MSWAPSETNNGDCRGQQQEEEHDNAGVGCGDNNHHTTTNPKFRKVMRYLWDPERSNTDHENVIVVLGQEYNPKQVPQSEHDPVGADGFTTLWPEAFLQDVNSRIWMTYRKGFKVIPKAKNGPSALSLGGLLRGSGLDLAGFTSDVGWGCMIRTGQSLLANALTILKLGRGWRKQDPCNEETEIITAFVDDPEQPFSLHKFVEHGKQYCGKMPGEWFGPSAAASSIKALCDENSMLRVYISDGSDVYENRFMQEAKKTGEFEPTLILMGIRLGIDQVNPVYWDALKTLLRYPQSVGIAGGRPSSSHYFFGFQNNDLFYLDPHFVRDALKVDDLQSTIGSVHTTRIRMLHLDEMDPSMLVGFLIKDESDWLDWKQRVVDYSSDNTRTVISVSAKEPAIVNCESSISLGSDDEGEFIDVGFGETGDDSPPVSSPKDDEPVQIDPEAVKEEPVSIERSQSFGDSADDEEYIQPQLGRRESAVTDASGDDFYGVPVMIESKDMLNSSNQSSYVEPSCLDFPPPSESVPNSLQSEEDWEYMRTAKKE